MHESELDRLLEAARKAPALPSDALMARVLADALAAQPQPAASAPPVPARPGPAPGLWARIAAGFGGAGVFASLFGAAALGVLVGYANPASLAWLTSDYLTTAGAGIEMIPVADLFLTEG
jgi:hypothetical protein